jgi:hypothetical protein
MEKEHAVMSRLKTERPRRLTTVTIAFAFVLTGIVLMCTEAAVWLPILNEHPEWQYARISRPTEEERAHALIMYLLGLGLVLSGMSGLVRRTSFCSWLAALGRDSSNYRRTNWLHKIRQLIYMRRSAP